jgi:hypothetical protein
MQNITGYIKRTSNFKVIISILVIIIIGFLTYSYTMKVYDTNIYLPVSLGEAIDKLTILDIKLERIKDDRKKDVQREYDLLNEKLSIYVNKYNDLYQSMKKVNTIIWDMMDVLRDGIVSNDEYLKVCKECIEYNDIRFRVKNKINYASNSVLKEQKSYKVNRVFIKMSDNIKETDDFVRPIKYFSFFYDEIVIKDNGEIKLREVFRYDPTILFITEDTENYKENSKKQFVFEKDFYDKEEIFRIFEINEDNINSIL